MVSKARRKLIIGIPAALLSAYGAIKYGPKIADKVADFLSPDVKRLYYRLLKLEDSNEYIDVVISKFNGREFTDIKSTIYKIGQTDEILGNLRQENVKWSARVQTLRELHSDKDFYDSNLEKVLEDLNLKMCFANKKDNIFHLREDMPATIATECYNPKDPSYSTIKKAFDTKKPRTHVYDKKSKSFIF